MAVPLARSRASFYQRALLPGPCRAASRILLEANQHTEFRNQDPRRPHQRRPGVEQAELFDSVGAAMAKLGLACRGFLVPDVGYFCRFAGSGGLLTASALMPSTRAHCYCASSRGETSRVHRANLP